MEKQRIAEIKEIVNRETRAWDTQDADLLMTIFHPDFVWAWPPTNRDHDPITWEMVMGKFEPARWRAFYADFFARHTLVHNKRTTQRIQVSTQGDGAFAVVDIDTLWKDGDGNEALWLGRVCKVYALTADGWKLTMHTGVLDYGDMGI